VFGDPVTVAKNCCVLGAPLEAAMKAYGGEIVTATGPVAPEIWIVALPLRDGSE